MRVVQMLTTVLVVAVVGPAALAMSALTASAATPSGILGLTTANIGKKACAINSLGGRAFESSCTGNGGQPEYWCADFARWVWAKAGVADTSQLSAQAGSFYTYGEQYGTLSSVPAVGDAVVFNYNGGGDAQHVAIVTEVNLNGTITSVSGDWNGQSGSEAHFASTSSVVLNVPAYLGVLGTSPSTMGMTISAFVAPVGVNVVPVVGGTLLAAGQTLTAGQELTSPNALYTLTMQGDGNLVEYVGTRVLWAAGTEGHPGARAVMQADGNLVVYSSGGVPLWSSRTGGHSGGNVSLALKDDASLVVHGASGALWTLRPDTDTLGTNQVLVSGQRLVSADGLYTLIMQSDGNLVESTARRPLWSTDTGNQAGARVVFQADGNLVVYGSGGVVLWSSRTGGHRDSGVTLVLTDDALLAVNGPTGQIWSNRA